MVYMNFAFGLNTLNITEFCDSANSKDTEPSFLINNHGLPLE